MGDYTPKHKPGHAITFTASAAVTGGQQVEVTGDYEVGPAGAASTKVVGQAGHDAGAGQLVTVHTPGRPVHTAEATGTVSAGDTVVSAAGGLIAAGAGTFTTRLGLALTSGGAGDDIDYQAV
jgi:hypothetical protein